VKVNNKAAASGAPLVELARNAETIDVRWGEEAAYHRSTRPDRTFVARKAWSFTARGFMATLAEWPFEAATTDPLDPTWWADYRSIHGWAFFLKGAGHRLVSSRIVDRGPWLRLRDEARDLTMFQFHDLDVDGETALAQARLGHALLRPVWLGGHYASQLGVFRGAAGSYKPTFYDASTQTSIVLVQEREVSREEMGIAAATRVHQIFPEPVEQVAFVFIDEAAARRQLADFWLYGLEVRAMTAAGERRIDQDYEPPPVPPLPDWVR
jgi:hypothetical protein